MSARQYKPLFYTKLSIPLIVYTVKDENPLDEIYDPTDHNSINNHLDTIYKQFISILSKGNYHILFIWNLNGHRMTDIWMHDMKNWSDSGPLVNCITFRDLNICNDAGIASGDSLIVLGREEEFRRSVNNFEEYLNPNNHFATFPKNMQPTESFFS